MASNALKIPELFPQPKVIEKLGGDSDFSVDVRLVTSNVQPLQRKAIRSILTAEGVRVVANKKKYVVNVYVEQPENFNLAKVPVNCRKDYYELTVSGSELCIRAPGQDGTVWATYTAASLFRIFMKGGKLPNMVIKDWPVLPVRGIFVENKWGPDRMTFIDWCRTIDELSAMKMNVLGIGLYGCWGSCRYEGENRPTEFLMVPVPEHDELKTVHHLRWYSPAKDTWNNEEYLPQMRENDTLLTDVINYASERGVTVIPFFNSFGHNTFFAREIPEISAKDRNGNPTGVGYCITSKKTREFVEKLYTSILDKYYPNGAEYFHIQMDEVWPDYPWTDDPEKIGDPWCKCGSCRRKKAQENLVNYLIWLVDMLVKKGVKKVVMWNDQLSRHMKILDDKFAKRLEEAGLKDKLILHWWWYSNEKLDDTTRVAIGRKLGISGWIAPMTCYFNWSTYDYRRDNIELMMRMGDAEKAEGAVSYAVHDPSHLDHEALLAAYAWESTKKQTKDAVQQRWALSNFGDLADKYMKAVDLVREAVTPSFGICNNYGYTYIHANQYPRRYPGEALDKLEEKDDAAEGLDKAFKCASEAAAIFEEIAAAPSLSDQASGCISSLRADAARIQAIAGGFIYLLDLRAKLQGGMVLKSMVTSTLKARDELCERMAVVEKYKPTWVMPATMQALSTLLAFFEQLAEDLRKHAARKQAKLIRWSLEAK